MTEQTRQASFNNIQENLNALASAAEQSLQTIVYENLPKPPPKVVSIWKEFRDFAFQGSIIDLAVGIILGGAVGSVINSLVNDIVMPPIGWLLSGVDFANIFLLLKRGKKNKLTKGQYKSLSQAKEDGAVTVNVGVFLNSVLNFVVISVIIFAFVRTINQAKEDRKHKDKEGKSHKTKKCIYCYSKIDFRARKCPYCTSILPSISVANSSSAPAIPIHSPIPPSPININSHNSSFSQVNGHPVFPPSSTLDLLSPLSNGNSSSVPSIPVAQSSVIAPIQPTASNGSMVPQQVPDSNSSTTQPTTPPASNGTNIPIMKANSNGDEQSSGSWYYGQNDNYFATEYSLDQNTQFGDVGDVNTESDSDGDGEGSPHIKKGKKANAKKYLKKNLKKQLSRTSLLLGK